MGIGRPRDQRRGEAILTATRDLLAERGYAAMSVEGVAERAGTAKTTIYRRWPDKRALVMAAMADYLPLTSAVSPANTFRDDLLAHASRLAAVMRGYDGRLALGLIQARPSDPLLIDEMERRRPSGGRLPASVVERAVTRGELSSLVDHHVFEEIVGAMMLMRLLHALPLDDDFVHHIVDDVVIPAFLKLAAEGSNVDPRMRP